MEAPAMESMRWVGVDVHAKESVAAVLDHATGEVSTHRIAGRPEDVLDWLATVAQPFRAVYEAGPTGYGLVRRAEERGLDVVVCAPGHILKSATDHIKVDKRDAVRLARLLSAGRAPSGPHSRAGRGAVARLGSQPRRRARRPDPDPQPNRQVPAPPRALSAQAGRELGRPPPEVAAATALRGPCFRA